MARRLQAGDALILLDVQRDFFPGGPVEVPDADRVIPVLNDWIREARDTDAQLIAVREWHPAYHISFKSEGGSWPPHCVQDTPGAFFHASLRLPHDAVVVSKGTAFDVEGYSAFDGTGLEHFLRRRHLHRLWFGGLNEETSLRRSVEDACEFGFEAHVIVDATRPLQPAADEHVLMALESRGARLERSSRAH